MTEAQLTSHVLHAVVDPILEQLGGLVVDELRDGEVVVFRNPVGRLRHVVCHDGDAWICACCDPRECAATLYILMRAFRRRID